MSELGIFRHHSRRGAIQAQITCRSFHRGLAPKDYTNDGKKDRPPENSQHREFKPLQFAWTARRQDDIAPVPPKKRSKISTVNKNNKSRRNKAEDCKQQAQAREEPRSGKQVIKANPNQPHNNRGEHHLVLVLDHKRSKLKPVGSLVRFCHIAPSVHMITVVSRRLRSKPPIRGQSAAVRKCVSLSFS